MKYIQNIPPKVRHIVVYSFAVVGLLAIGAIVSKFLLLDQPTPYPYAEKSIDYVGEPGFSGGALGVPAPSGVGGSVVSGILDIFDSRGIAQNESFAPTVDTDNAEETDRKVVKTGSLSMFVEKAEETAPKIKVLAEDMGGFVVNSQIYETSLDSKSANVTIKVPADKFDETMEALKELAVEVERENESARDVTEEFVDLEARLSNLEAQEEQYLEILKRAYTIEDILSVTNRLNSVRQQIEQLEG